MVAQFLLEQPTSNETPELRSKQTIEIGAVRLMFPIEVDPKPYIRQILRVTLESITHPKAHEYLEIGLSDATTDEDWSRRINDEHRLVYGVENDRIRLKSARFHYDK